MRYLPPFEWIRRSIEISTVRGKSGLNVSDKNSIAIPPWLIPGIKVDEAWYVHAHQDIGNAMKGGAGGSARLPFVHDGYFEAWLPFPIRIEEQWYPVRHPAPGTPGLAERVRSDVAGSARDPFDKGGYREGAACA